MDKKKQKIISTWKSRIYCAGYKTMGDFLDELGVHKVRFSEFISFKAKPNEQVFEKIESKLQSLKV